MTFRRAKALVAVLAIGVTLPVASAEADAILTLDYTTPGHVDVSFDLNGAASNVVGYQITFVIAGSGATTVTFGDFFRTPAQQIVDACIAIPGSCDLNPTISDLLDEVDLPFPPLEFVFSGFKVFPQTLPLSEIRPSTTGAGLLFSVDYTGPKQPAFVGSASFFSEEVVDPRAGFVLVDIPYVVNAIGAVPEPATISLILVAAGFGFRARRRFRS